MPLMRRREATREETIELLLQGPRLREAGLRAPEVGLVLDRLEALGGLYSLVIPVDEKELTGEEDGRL